MVEPFALCSTDPLRSASHSGLIATFSSQFQSSKVKPDCQAEKIVTLAETDFRGEHRRFGIRPRDRLRHIYVVGKTGTGKTTLLKNMALQDISGGRGLGIIDPHGDLAEDILDFIPAWRVRDVVYFDPGDLENPVGFNPLEDVEPDRRHLVCSGIIEVFKKMWADSWGPRLEYVLRHAILALLEVPGSTLLGVMRMLSDRGYRRKVVERLSDPVVKNFWRREFERYPERFASEAIAPIQNKVGQFLTNPLIRNIVGQRRSSLDLRRMMDEGKIFVANLSKGKIGEDNSSLLGAMLVTKLQLAAMGRVELPECERREFYLYVDEFQNFATRSFADLLSEARKYHLGLVLAHQYISQMEEELRDAVFGNVGTIICFQVGSQDAEFLEGEFGPRFRREDLMNVPFGRIYLKLSVEGSTSQPFSARTLPPPSRPPESHRHEIINFCRERYATKKEDVEREIASWMEEVPSCKEDLKVEPPEVPHLSLKEATSRKPIPFRSSMDKDKSC